MHASLLALVRACYGSRESAGTFTRKRAHRRVQGYINTHHLRMPAYNHTRTNTYMQFWVGVYLTIGAAVILAQRKTF